PGELVAADLFTEGPAPLQLTDPLADPLDLAHQSGRDPRATAGGLCRLSGHERRVPETNGGPEPERGVPERLGQQLDANRLVRDLNPRTARKPDVLLPDDEQAEPVKRGNRDPLDPILTTGTGPALAARPTSPTPGAEQRVQALGQFVGRPPGERNREAFRGRHALFPYSVRDRVHQRARL